MGPVQRMNLVDIQRCRDAAARDISVGALGPKRANALFRQLGQRVREIRRLSASLAQWWVKRSRSSTSPWPAPLRQLKLGTAAKAAAHWSACEPKLIPPAGDRLRLVRADCGRRPMRWTVAVRRPRNHTVVAASSARINDANGIRVSKETFDVARANTKITSEFAAALMACRSPLWNIIDHKEPETISCNKRRSSSDDVVSDNAIEPVVPDAAQVHW